MIYALVFLPFLSSVVCYGDYEERTLKLRERALSSIVNNYFAHDPFLSSAFSSDRHAKQYSPAARDEYQQATYYPTQTHRYNFRSEDYSTTPRQEYQQYISPRQTKELMTYPHEEYARSSQYFNQESHNGYYRAPKSDNYYTSTSKPENYDSVPVYNPQPEYHVKRSYVHYSANPTILEKTVYYPAPQPNYQQVSARRSRVYNPYPDHLSQFQGRRSYYLIVGHQIILAKFPRLQELFKSTSYVVEKNVMIWTWN